MDTSSIPGLELLQIADVVAREKSIEREEVIAAMEDAIQKAGRSKYGHDRDIRAMMTVNPALFSWKDGQKLLKRWKMTPPRWAWKRGASIIWKPESF